jgi:UDP-N-acetylmuramoylalanine--D-glutamate ligase
MLKAWRPDTVLAGNLRSSALTKLPEIKADTPIVLELSSWQLEGMGEQQISPAYAAVTNMSPDHLDRYKDMDDYAVAKQNICRWQKPGDIAILNATDQIVSKFAEIAGGNVGWFAPTALLPGDFGTYLEDGQIFWQDATGHEELIAATSLVKMPGQHNLMNVLTATALARSAGVPNEKIVEALTNFKGVPDRLELVRELAGVRYYNDTTSTSPAATIAALEAFQDTANAQAKIILIAGGADKQLQFELMAEAIANPRHNVKQVILLKGSATERLAEAIAAKNFKQVSGPYNDFAQAITSARVLAAPGEIVLLSPGCASFGMFTHEFDRGQQFREIVNNL